MKYTVRTPVLGMNTEFNRIDACSHFPVRSGLNAWKECKETPLYNWKLVEDRLRRLSETQATGNIHKMTRQLRSGAPQLDSCPLHYHVANFLLVLL
jgi:hypothetical protein